MKKLVIVMSLLCMAVSAQASKRIPAPAAALQPSIARAEAVAIKYKALLLQVRGAEYLATVRCSVKTGEVQGLIADGPVVACIAVRLKGAPELAQAENALPNPMTLDGVAVHFMDQDPEIGKGGISIHN
jgi:hypothetical protein